MGCPPYYRIARFGKGVVVWFAAFIAQFSQFQVVGQVEVISQCVSIFKLIFRNSVFARIVLTLSTDFARVRVRRRPEGPRTHRSPWPWAAAALQYEQRGAHGDNFCHRDDHEEAVSPFNLFEYVAHMKGRSGVMGTKRRAPD